MVPVKIPKRAMVNYFQLDCVSTPNYEVIGVFNTPHGEQDIPYRMFKVIADDSFLCSETAEPMG